MNQNAEPLEVIKLLNSQPFMYLDSEQFELDTIPGWYVLTHWLPESVGCVIRLKLQHSSRADCNPFVCEFRSNQCEDFQQLAGGELHAYFVNRADEFPDEAMENYLAFPEPWRGEFWQIARRLAAILDITELGATVSKRYAGEPETSRDFFECDEPPNHR